MIIGLIIILLLVLTLPFLVKKIEENLEPFLFIMGFAASIISGEMSVKLFLKALEEPVMIALAVLIAGAAFFVFQDHFSRFMTRVLEKFPAALVVFLVIVILGLLSSIITAIIASIILVEILVLLPLDRKHKVNVCILACMAIGLGAALTPIGEPLATIAISKLGKDFFFLLNLLGKFIIPSVLVLGVIGAVYTARISQYSDNSLDELNEELLSSSGLEEDENVENDNCEAEELALAVYKSESAGEEEIEEENWKAIVMRALKVYLFVMALVLLGEGFKPLIDAYILKLDYHVLYWINMISAVLDNATLTAAEISHQMSSIQVEAILMGLLISGAMLIPGNIPNIISASKLKISSKEWAVTGVPLGLAVMLIFYFILF